MKRLKRLFFFIKRLPFIFWSFFQIPKVPKYSPYKFFSREFCSFCGLPDDLPDDYYYNPADYYR